MKNETAEEIFLREINKITHKDAVIVDIGCGDNGYISTVEKRQGIGIDEDVYPGLDKTYFILGDAANIPLKDNCCHIVIAHWSMEHVRNPQKVVKEIHRILNNPGAFIFATPHRYYFTSLASSVIPWNTLKSRLMGWRVYPTYYRFNTPDVIRKILNSVGFNEISLNSTYEPTWTASKILNLLIWPLNYIYKSNWCGILPPRATVGVFIKKCPPL